MALPSGAVNWNERREIFVNNWWCGGDWSVKLLIPTSSDGLPSRAGPGGMETFFLYLIKWGAFAWRIQFQWRSWNTNFWAFFPLSILLPLNVNCSLQMFPNWSVFSRKLKRRGIRSRLENVKRSLAENSTKFSPIRLPPSSTYNFKRLWRRAIMGWRRKNCFRILISSRWSRNSFWQIPCRVKKTKKLDSGKQHQLLNPLRRRLTDGEIVFLLLASYSTPSLIRIMIQFTSFRGKHFQWRERGSMRWSFAL